MFIPDDETELAKLVWWTNPPKDEINGRHRSRWLLENLEERPALKFVDVPNKEEELFKFALKLRAVGRPGLYVAFLIVLALGGHPFACLIIAGILTQRIAEGTCRNERALRRRINGWLKTPKATDFTKALGLPSILFTLDFDQKRMARAADRTSELRRQIDLNERKVTLIEGTLEKWKSDASSSERYVRLNRSLDLKGNVDRVSSDRLIIALRHEYPWADDLLRDIGIALTLSISSGKPWLALPPLLLVGPAGVGKTRFVRRLSELSGVPFRVVNAGGSSDSRDFSGTARGWGSAKPARIVEILRETETANPIVLVDEIDKAGGSDRNGRMTATLLTMLEPETRGKFYDEALAANVDLSHVNWILAANDISGLGQPLLSRVRLVRMPQPPAAHAGRIIETIVADIGRKRGWPTDALPDLEPEVKCALITAVERGMSPRRLNAVLEEIFAIEARRRLAS